MILRKVTLDNWRALSHFEMALEPGVNVLQGPNEAGKSSLVEALDWALYRDITGARLNLEDVRAIIPATDPTARPTVQVEVEFPDCTAVLTKTLAEDSGKRECKLSIRRPGMADEHFDRTEAQRRLRALFASDGLGSEKGSVAEAGLLISHQGEGSDFLSDGSTAIRSTLGVATDGNLALTTRLERVRLGVENTRRKELMQDLEFEALSSARASTEAARVRERLAEATQKVAHFEAVAREMEALRDEIIEADCLLTETVVRETEARTRFEQQNRLVLEQTEAEKEVATAEAAHRDADNRREAAATRAREVEHLRRAQAADEKALEECAAAVTAAREALEAAHAAHDAAQEACERAEAEAEEAKRYAEAWRCYANVFDTREAKRNEERAMERLELLSQQLQEAQTQKDATPKAPTWEELRSWRTGWDEYQRLQSEASQSLQLELEAAVEAEVSFEADGGDAQALKVSPAEPLQLNAMGDAVLQIPGFGRIRLRSGARGVAEIKAEVDRAAAQLSQKLALWELSLDALPEAFGVWEQQRTLRDEVEKIWQTAADALRAEEQRAGSQEEACQRVENRAKEFEAAKLACEPYSGLIELGGKTRSEVKTAQDAAEKTSREATSRSTRARNEVATALQRLRVAETEWNEVSKRPDALRAAMQGRAEQLARLENDGLSPEQRTAHVDELSAALWQARQRMEETKSRRAEMGNSISAWQMEEARKAHLRIAEERGAVEKRLVELRRDLFHHCEVDAAAELEKWRSEAEALEAQAAGHEARLRGIAILDAALQLERSRLGRALAGPLNEKLSPWLSSLRGKETAIEFDEGGSKIEAIRTSEGEATISLPYAEHSEGMKEQTAFALRLLLASRVAHHLPSGRLPVILDDPFTQSDASRRHGLGTVLAEAAASLQILFVTCHQDHFAAEVPVHWIRLGDWPEAKRGGKRKAIKLEGAAPAVKVPEVGTLTLW